MALHPKRRLFRTHPVRETMNPSTPLRNRDHTKPLSKEAKVINVMAIYQGMLRKCQVLASTSKMAVQLVMDRVDLLVVPSTEASAKLSLKKLR